MRTTNRYDGAWTKGFAEVENGQLYYERLGTGTPLVFLHGFNLDTRMWDGIFETLGECYQVVRFDMRAFGQSPATQEPFSIYEDIRALLDALEIDSAFLIGHSLGGSMAQEFALAYPERVLGLIFTCSGLTGHPVSDISKQTRAKMQELYQAGDMEALLEYDVSLLLDGPAAPGRVQGPVRERLKDIRRLANSTMFNGNYPKLLDPLPSTRLEDIQVPVLTQYGDLDWPEFQDISDILVKRIPNAKQVLLEQTAHNGCMEQPDAFARLVDFFVQEKTAPFTS